MSLQRPGSADVEQLSEKDEREAAPIIDSFDLTVVSYLLYSPPSTHPSNLTISVSVGILPKDPKNTTIT